MAHPFNAHRDHKVQHERVADIAKACGGRMAVGGAAHSDAGEDRKLVHQMVKKRALRATGGAVKARSDRPSRAFGGRLGKKKKSGGKHTVNVIVAPHPPALGAGLPAKPPVVPGVAAMPPGVPPPGPAGGPPMPPPRPMVPPPPGPMGGPPGVAPPPGVIPPPMRKRGGAVFSGGKSRSFTSNERPAAFTTKGKPVNVDGPGTTSQTAGAGKGRTPIKRSFPSNKQDTPNIGRGSVITKATGGSIMSDSKPGTDMGPKFTGGGFSGIAKLEKMRRLKRSGYGGSNASIMNPTQNPKP